VVDLPLVLLAEFVELVVLSSWVELTQLAEVHAVAEQETVRIAGLLLSYELVGSSVLGPPPSRQR